MLKCFVHDKYYYGFTKLLLDDFTAKTISDHFGTIGEIPSDTSSSHPWVNTINCRKIDINSTTNSETTHSIIFRAHINANVNIHLLILSTTCNSY